MLVVTAQPQLRRVVHRRHKHLGLVVPVVRVGELDELDIIHGHVVQHQDVLDAHVFLDAPPVVLDGVEALRDADLLAFQVLHAEDLVAGAHLHHPALVDPRRPQQHGAADVGVDGDRGIQTSEADQVVEVVDIVRVEVVLGCGAEVGVLDADLLVLLTAPAQLLVDIVSRHHRAVGVPHLFPVQWYCCGNFFCSHSFLLFGMTGFEIFRH